MKKLIFAFRYLLLIAFIFLAVSFLIPNSIQKIIIQRIHNLFYNDLNEYLKLQIYNTLFMLLLGFIIMLIIFILGYFIILNLLDKNYQKPATYAQDGRRININLKKSY